MVEVRVIAKVDFRWVGAVWEGWVGVWRLIVTKIVRF
jgi:hypothetical protein